MNPAVSVIMPAHNAGKYVASAIESVLAQTMPDFELVVVDDGSTDDTVGEIEKFQDARIRLYRNGRNKGVSYSRNRAIRECRGEWIALLDADDWWSPFRLERLLHAAETYQASMVGDDLAFIRDGDDHPFTTLFTSRTKVYGPISQPRFITVETMIEKDFGYLKPLFRKSILETAGIAYDERLQHAEDFKLMTECLCTGNRMLLIPEPLYYYRRRPHSLSAPDTLEKQLSGNRTHIRICEELLRKYPGRPGVRRAIRSRITANRVKIAELLIEENLRSRRYFGAMRMIVKQPRVLRPILRNVKNKWLS